MKKSNFSKLFICFLIMFSISCEESKLTELPINLVDSKIMTEDLTVQSAQIWFETKIKKKNSARIESTKEPLWEYAVESKQNDGTTVISAPLLINEKKQSFGLVFQETDVVKQKKQFEEKNKQANGLSTPEKLVMIRDSKGSLSTYQVKIMADYKYFENSLKKEKKSITKNDGNDFDGILFFSEWSTPQNLEGLKIKNGKLNGKITSGKINSNARLASDCSTYTVTISASCNQTKVSEQSYPCSISQNYTVCGGGVYTGSSGGEGSTTFFNFATVMSGGGPAPLDILSSSYRQNQVNIFTNEAALYGVTFNPDEKLDFRDNFENFLKIKDDLMSTIQRWGNKSTDWFENKLQDMIRGIKSGERIKLQNSGPFDSYRINLMLYVNNAYQAEKITNLTMSILGLNGSYGSSCSACRGNAVKHSAWNILNAGTFGRLWAIALSEAHEVGEINQLEVSMDLNNNRIGILLHDLYGTSEALSKLADIVKYGFPNNNFDGLKFIKDGQLVWTKDFQAWN